MPRKSKADELVHLATLRSKGKPALPTAFSENVALRVGKLYRGDSRYYYRLTPDTPIQGPFPDSETAQADAIWLARYVDPTLLTRYRANFAWKS